MNHEVPRYLICRATWVQTISRALFPHL